MRRLSKIDIVFNLQIAIAFTLSVFIAMSLNLQNGITAGVITILSIQRTRKDTLLIALKRLLGYFIVVILVYLIFSFLGFSIVTLGLFVLVFSFINYLLDISVGLAPNVVMAGHFYISQDLSFDFILNETYIYLIGIVVALIVNFTLNRFNYNRDKVFSELDEIVKARLLDIAKLLDCNSDEFMKEESLTKTKTKIESNFDSSTRRFQEIEQILVDDNRNTLINSSLYNLEYFYMRSRQLETLIRILNHIEKMTLCVEQSQINAIFLRIMEKNFNKGDEVFGRLIEENQKIYESMRKSELPKSREEFENRAILFVILQEIEIFLNEKQSFNKWEEYENRNK